MLTFSHQHLLPSLFSVQRYCFVWARLAVQSSACLIISDWSPCSDLAPLLLHILRTAHCTPLLYEISSSGVSMCGIYIGSLDPNMDTVAVKWDRTLDRDTREHLFNSFCIGDGSFLQRLHLPIANSSDTWNKLNGYFYYHIWLLTQRCPKVYICFTGLTTIFTCLN